ncbi:MAG: TonB-dependent receptor [Proteobacteria bacterium]|nr:TonB-dependent receptor [Pseudomonadota bacterium]
MIDGRMRSAAAAGVFAILTVWSALAAPHTVVHAANEPSGLQGLKEVVINATAVSGAKVPLNDIPGNVQVLSAADLSRQGTASLTTALNTQLGSINVNDDMVDPFQPDILYRGFEASPVGGTPQGLAVYVDGVRVNEAFGDSVNWDLILPSAIRRVEVVSSSAVYGLNALGGAISVTMKNGFNHQGGDVELSGGSFHRQEITAQYGAHSGMLGFYVAGRGLNWKGWRAFSSDQLRDLYAVVSLHGSAGSLDLSYAWDDNNMKGQSPVPVQELALRRSLVFTGPQGNINRLKFLTLNGTLDLPASWSLSAVLYYRNFTQNVTNGNTTNYGSCAAIPGVLCQPDGVTPLTDSAGQPLPDISQGGSLYIGENDFEILHSWGRGATLQASNGGRVFGHDNEFTAGFAVDYAATSYYAGAQIGLLSPALIVMPSNLYVDTPEGSPGAIANGDAVPVGADSVNKSLGAYFTDTFNVTRALAMTASGRYNVAHENIADQLGTALNGFNRFAHFNPALGFSYKILPSLTLYGGYSVGNRIPTPGELECADPTAPCLLPSSLSGDPPLRQVVSHGTEIGFRGQVARLPGVRGMLHWNLSVFRTVVYNDIHAIATSHASGFFQNIGDTRRQGVEVGLNFHAPRWSAYANYSFVQATFLTAQTFPSPSNPFQDASGDIHVEAGDSLPGIPANRVKLGADFTVLPKWSIGAGVNIVSSVYYVGDESNQLAPIPGYALVNLHSSYYPVHHVELFASIDNLLNRRYGTWGVLSDPTGVGAPGIPDVGTNGPGVNNRFLSPGAPVEIFGGVRVRF